MAEKPVIDAVITWVDGNDRQHAKKLFNYLKSIGITRPESAAPTRFNQCGELKYCVYSLLKFAPWLRFIYIVTDEQRPEFLHEFTDSSIETKIKLVDHKEIFHNSEEVLPTFCSPTIETMLWRISGLAEHFIYFNDDCMLLRPVRYEDFFYNLQPVLRGSWEKFYAKTWRFYLANFFPKIIKSKFDLFRSIQENSAKLAGFSDQFLSLPHIPFVFRKSTLENYFAKNPEIFKANIKYKLRSEEQFMTASLAYHLEFKSNQGQIDSNLSALYINPAIHSLKKIKERLLKAEESSNIVFACFQSLDCASDELQKYLFEWLEERIGTVLK